MRLAPVYGLILISVVFSCGTPRAGGVISQQYQPQGWEQREIGVVSAPKTSSAAESTGKAAPDSVRQVAPPPQEKQVSTALSDQLVAYARTFTGTPYKLGAAGPSRFDCSGFTRYVYKHFGYELTQYSGAQFREGREVEGYSNLQKGDLVFFGKRGGVRNIGHVGIVVSVDRERGAFRFIHASSSQGVTESDSNHPYFMMRFIGARRILPDE